MKTENKSDTEREREWYWKTASCGVKPFFGAIKLYNTHCILLTGHCSKNNKCVTDTGMNGSSVATLQEEKHTLR